MKKILSILTLAVCLASCKKNTTTPTPPVAPPNNNNNCPTVTVNNATIIVGQSVTLVANGATSYTWSTMAISNSIVVSPTVTTNYTVTGGQGTSTASAVSKVTVLTNTNTGNGDSVWVDIRFENPQSSTFNYRYDTTNTRILLNGHRICNNKQNIYYDLPVNGGGLMRYCNYWCDNTHQINNPIHMATGDSITVEIDSLFYPNTNLYRGGGIYISVNAMPVINVTQPTKLIWDVANNANTGRNLGNALANGMGGTTQQFYWLLGGKFRYTWIKT
jgi:hypothetical protein